MYTLVVPVYKNAETIVTLVERVDQIEASLRDEDAGAVFEAIFVVDGSPDDSAALLRECLQSDARRPARRWDAKIIELTRNFGSFAAIRRGLDEARGDFLAVMAADLQEPARLIIDFFLTLKREPVDVVIGTRTQRNDPALSQFSSSLFWACYRRLVQPEIPPGGVDVFGCTRAVGRVLAVMPEANSSLVGLLFWIGFRRKLINYERSPRPVGRSAWTFRRKLRYVFDSVFAFSDFPILTLLVMGVFGVMCATGIGVVVLGCWLVGKIEVSGYTPLMLAILMSAGMNCAGQGILGCYLWRTFENTKRRPPHLSLMQETFLAGSAERQTERVAAEPSLQRPQAA